MNTTTRKPIRKVLYKNSKSQLSCFCLTVLVILFSSCVSKKNLNYFPDIQDVTIQSQASHTEPLVQVNDLLSIIVSSQNPEASAVFNAPNESANITSAAASSSNTLTIGYLVNQNGDIQFPLLGMIHVAGQTKSQISAYISRQIIDRKLLIDPIITIRYLNFRVSVMGEVNKPGVYTTPIEKLTILEALSFAGDATIYGEKNNVLLIRENEKGEKMVKHLDLTKSQILSSPYYYLKSNDVIIVETNSGKIQKERNALLVPIILSLVSLAIVVLNYVHTY